MKTNFFTELKKLNLKQITLSVVFLEDTATISVLPISNSEDSATKLKPITLNGKMEDCDNLFFDTINAPLKETASFFTNVEDYEKTKKEKELETSQAKAEKEKIKKYEDKLTAIVSSKEFNPKDEKEKVEELVKKLLEISNKNTLAIHWKMEIDKLNAPKLF